MKRSAIFFVSLYSIVCCLATTLNAASNLDTTNGLPVTVNLAQSPAGTITVIPPTNVRGFFAATVADIDNDGFDDVIAIGARNYVSDNQFTPVIYIIYGSASLPATINMNSPSVRTASIVWTNNTDLRMRDVQVADLNGDGLKEICFIGLPLGMVGGYEVVFAIPGSGVWQGETSVSENTTGVMKFYAQISAGDFNIMKQLQEYILADLTGDGITDILLSYPLRVIWSAYDEVGQLYLIKGGSQLTADNNAENHSLKVTRIEGDTTYWNYSALFTADGSEFSGMYSFAKGDLDGDGKKDLVFDGGINRMLSMTSPPDWLSSWLYAPTWIIKGSVFTSKQYQDSIFSLTDRVDGAGYLYTSGQIPPDFMHKVAIGDLNGDGYDDLFIGYPYEGTGTTGPSRIYTLFGNQNFSVTGNIDNFPQAKLTILPKVSSDTVGYRFAFGDINGDGFGDCMIAAASNKFYVLYGRNSFPASIQLGDQFPYGSTISGGSVVACGDINNDGFQDIVANSANGIVILLGRGRISNTGETVVRSLPTVAKARAAYTFSDGTELRMAFSEGRASSNTQLSLTYYGGSLPDSLRAIPVTSKVLSFTDLQLTNLIGSVKVTCTIGFTDSALSAHGMSRGNLTVSYWNPDNSRWTVLATTVDSTRNLATFTTDHFSLFALTDKTDSLMTDVQGSPAQTPATFALMQNYPNPFNPTTLIRFQIPKSSNTVIKIYNILGQEVRTLLNKTLPSGSYEVQWDGTNNLNQPVASGIYIYRLEVGQNILAKKMALMR